MEFKRIDLDSWNRKEYFQHYFTSVPCTYSITVKLDITRIIMSGQKLYPTMLYGLSKMVNRHEEFRTNLDKDGHLGVYNQLSPCYTIFHKDTETFSNLWTEYSENYERFCCAYYKDKELYGSIPMMNAKTPVPENTFTVSMIPWESFDSFHLHLQKGYDYLLPIFTMGKYIEEKGRFILPLAIQVHHAVCDGFHVCRFIQELREWIEQIL